MLLPVLIFDNRNVGSSVNSPLGDKAKYTLEEMAGDVSELIKVSTGSCCFAGVEQQLIKRVIACGMEDGQHSGFLNGKSAVVSGQGAKIVALTTFFDI